MVNELPDSVMICDFEVKTCKNAKIIFDEGMNYKSLCHVFVAASLLGGGELLSREVRPADTTKLIEKVGLIACFSQKNEAPSMVGYKKLKPNLILWMGDNIYSDTKDMEVLKKNYEALKDRAEFKDLRSIPQMATWDDHDMGWNNAGAEYEKREESKEIFMDFWKFPKDPAIRQQPGVYNSNIFGPNGKKVQVIMLDARYAKTKDRVLDEAQWTWLEKQLEMPAELRLIVSGQQVLVSANTNFETWAKCPQEQKRLFELIKSKKANGVIFLSGDQHFGEISKIPKALGYDALEWTFAGINQDEKEFANDFRVGPVVHEKNKYSWLEINWEQDPVVTFTISNVEGKELLKNEVKLSELKAVE